MRRRKKYINDPEPTGGLWSLEDKRVITGTSEEHSFEQYQDRMSLNLLLQSFAGIGNIYRIHSFQKLLLLLQQVYLVYVEQIYQFVLNLHNLHSLLSG